MVELYGEEELATSKAVELTEHPSKNVDTVMGSAVCWDACDCSAPAASLPMLHIDLFFLESDPLPAF